MVSDASGGGDASGDGDGDGVASPYPEPLPSSPEPEPASAPHTPCDADHRVDGAGMIHTPMVKGVVLTVLLPMGRFAASPSLEKRQLWF